MASSLSPEHNAGGSPEGVSPTSEKGVLGSLNLGFLKSLSEKKVTRSGNPPKRRGPKPDSKPALTRRQELNRQAQRTHRERKELYIKALEDEVLRLKEIFSTISQDKQQLIEENKQLKEMLAQNGIQYTPRGGTDDITSNQSVGQPSATSISGNSYAHGSHGGFSSPLTSQSTAMSMSPPSHQTGQSSLTGNQPAGTARGLPAGRQIDLEQAGIDFVLTLEKPCMVHMPFLVDRASDTDGEPCGHALMASCPPAPFPELTPQMPFGSTHTHDNGGEQPPQGTWELTKADLSTLLDLSKKLDLDGEITPVMSWGIIMSHPRFNEMVPEDFERLADELVRKVRCYGFGAVMEEFELRDALENVFSSRADAMMF